MINSGGFIAKPQGKPQAAEPINEPLAGVSVSLLAPTRCARPNQRIGQATGMQHRSAAARPTDHGDRLVSDKLIPVVWPVLLMPSQGEPWALPLIEAQHGAACLALLQQHAVQCHLGVTIRPQGGDQPSRRDHAGTGRRVMRHWSRLPCCLGGIYRS